jgi:hypothetical protein
MALVNLTFEQRKRFVSGIGKQNAEYPPRSHDITPLDFFLCSALQNSVYTSTPRALQDLKLHVPLFHQQQYRTSASLLYVVVNNALRLAVDILNICDFKCENVTILFLFIYVL